MDTADTDEKSKKAGIAKQDCGGQSKILPCLFHQAVTAFEYITAVYRKIHAGADCSGKNIGNEKMAC